MDLRVRILVLQKQSGLFLRNDAWKSAKENPKKVLLGIRKIIWMKIFLWGMKIFMILKMKIKHWIRWKEIAL